MRPTKTADRTGTNDPAMTAAGGAATPQRSRTVTWEDPMIGAGWAREMAGLDYLQGIRNGDVPPPPFALLIGMEAPIVQQGRATFSLQPGEHLYNPIGTVHGGVLSTLLDSAMGCAVHTTLPRGVGFTTVDLSVTFLRPVTRDTPTLRCEGEVVHAGRSIATARGRITDDAGKLYATASTTCMILRSEL
jgi:uncharacterized protein (TIGR00369 family)